MVVLGAGLVVAAVLGVVAGARNWPLWRVLRMVRPTTPDRLAAAAADGHLDGRVVAVTGTAGAGPGGLLSSSVNAQDCVWHRHTVHRRQITYHQTDRGMRQRTSRRQRVADLASDQPFTLRGTSAGVTVEPNGIRMHRPAAGSLRILPGLASEPFPAAATMMVPAQRMYWHREWTIRPGMPLFVLAEVHSYGKRFALHRPTRGPHIISTVGVQRVRRGAAFAAVTGLAIAPLAGIAGAVLLVLRWF
jgi:hypothetical protein